MFWSLFIIVKVSFYQFVFYFCYFSIQLCLWEERSFGWCIRTYKMSWTIKFLSTSCFPRWGSSILSVTSVQSLAFSTYHAPHTAPLLWEQRELFIALPWCPTSGLQVHLPVKQWLKIFLSFSRFSSFTPFSASFMDKYRALHRDGNRWMSGECRERLVLSAGGHVGQAAPAQMLPALQLSWASLFH